MREPAAVRRLPVVRVTIRGGVAYIDAVPPGIRVVIDDFDTDGIDDRAKRNLSPARLMEHNDGTYRDDCGELFFRQTAYNLKR